jgi:cytochrome c oxidase subunit IV
MRDRVRNGHGANQRMEATGEHEHVQSKRLLLFVWFWLLVLTGGEVFLAYQDLPLKMMLVILMGLSIIKASLIISYFMHLRYERRSLVLTLMPALVFVICMMFVVFPDSFRLLTMGVR